MDYTTYLFDFDYTLADSSCGIATCFRIVLDRHGYTEVAEEAIKRTIGKTLEESFSILTGGITDAELLAGFREEYSKEADIYMNVNTFLFPDAISTLERLKAKGAKIGIISTKYRQRIKDFLEGKVPDDLFDIIVGGEDVAQSKPHPEGLLYAIAQLHADIRKTVYIGDSTVDAETAQSAHVSFIGVTNGMTTCEELQVYPNRQIISSLSELTVNPQRRLGIHMYQLLAYKRFIHIKQIRGRKLSECTQEEFTCKNCGTVFTGKFCNNCGQASHTSKLTFKSAIASIFHGIAHMDHGFGFTLVDLLTRPGYMIHDYIQGKRVRYFPPFKALFVLAAVYLLLVQLIDPVAMHEEVSTGGARHELLQISRSETSLDNQTNDGLSDLPFVNAMAGLLNHWAHGNKAVIILCLVPILALSTKWAFRRRTFNRGYNYTELMFAQVYAACQILLISILCLPFNGKADLNAIYDIPMVVVILLSLWIYKQLFRGTWWQTFRRTLLVYFYSILIVTLFAAIVLSGYLVVAMA